MAGLSSVLSAFPATRLPSRPIPGSYGMPVLGPLKDRLDYFWFQGDDAFFRARMEKHKSTVFRTNLPPTFPFFVGVNPNMVAVVDVKSYSYLFDMALVEKKNVLVGDYMPSVSFTGDMRVVAYLDTTETKHAALKGFVMSILKRSSELWVSEFLKSVEHLFDELEKNLEGKVEAGFVLPMQKCLFNFLSKSIIGADPAKRPEIEEGGMLMLDSWLALMLLPTVSAGSFPQPFQEILLHSFPLPSSLTNAGYRKLYKFVEEEGKKTVKRGIEEYNLSKEEVIHNLLFVLGFNAFGGFSILLPTLLSTIGRNETGLKERLKEEVRSKGKNGLNFQTVKEMELLTSTVYEVLRLNPPVKLQYARARKDFVLSSHDSSFEIKQGELLVGYQPLAMRDPKIFDRAEDFVADRFTGERGRELLNYLFWSNGPQTATPTTANKQCAGKDYVVGTLFLLVAAILKRYDEFVVDDGGLNITKLAKAVTENC